MGSENSQPQGREQAKPPITAKAQVIVGVALTAMMAAGAYAVTVFVEPPSKSGSAVTDEAVYAAIKRNPEIVRDAIVELQRRDGIASAAQQGRVLADSMTAVQDPRSTAYVGNPDGDVTIIEFSDYNCSFCKRASKDVAALLKADPKLRVGIKELPVLGTDSIAAAKVAVAAKRQLQGERFLAFHLDLMDQRGRVGTDVATRVAIAHGADPERLRADLAEPLVNATIDNTLALGERLGINGTPAFIVGGEVVPGAIGEIALAMKVASIRKCGRASC